MLFIIFLTDSDYTELLIQKMYMTA